MVSIFKKKTDPYHWRRAPRTPLSFKVDKFISFYIFWHLDNFPTDKELKYLGRWRQFNWKNFVWIVLQNVCVKKTGNTFRAYKLVEERRVFFCVTWKKGQKNIFIQRSATSVDVFQPTTGGPTKKKHTDTYRHIQVNLNVQDNWKQRTQTRWLLPFSPLQSPIVVFLPEMQVFLPFSPICSRWKDNTEATFLSFYDCHSSVSRLLSSSPKRCCHSIRMDSSTFITLQRPRAIRHTEPSTWCLIWPLDVSAEQFEKRHKDVTGYIFLF